MTQSGGGTGTPIIQPSGLMSYNLFSATLALAKFISPCYPGIATGGTVTTILDTNNEVTDEQYNGGTVWLLTGANAGTAKTITDSGENTVTFTPAAAHAVVAGDEYLMATSKFTYTMLREAINTILEGLLIASYDITLTVDWTVDEYTLPTGVSDVRMVEVAGADASPYDWQVNRFWQISGGKLVFYGGIFASDDGKKIRLTYAAPHGRIAEAGTINPAILPDYLTYAAAVYLWRNLIQTSYQDEAEVGQMFNEAKMLEAGQKAAALSSQMRLPRHLIRMARW